MYATKEAVIAKEHDPELDAHIFFMDMRAFSKGYWSYFERARDRYGVNFSRGRPSSLFQDRENQDLILNYQDQDGRAQTERFDLVVLSVGMEISQEVQELGQRLGCRDDVEKVAGLDQGQNDLGAHVDVRVLKQFERQAQELLTPGASPSFQPGNGRAADTPVGIGHEFGVQFPGGFSARVGGCEDVEDRRADAGVS